MKKIFNMAALLLGAALLAGCELFAVDNLDAPAETLTGSVVDVATGNPVLTDQDSKGIRVRLMELSWQGNVTPQDFYCKPDGTFNNTKLFKGNYNIRVDGPFVPIYLEDAAGNVIYDETVTTDIKGKREVRFEVMPFLNVEIVGKPVVINGKIRANVKVTRATSVEAFKSKVEAAGWDPNYANITDVQLFVSYSRTCGERAKDDRYSSSMSFASNSFEPNLGSTVTLTSKGNILPGTKMFIRAAARINYDTPAGSGTRRYNYSPVYEVIVD